MIKIDEVIQKLNGIGSEIEELKILVASNIKPKKPVSLHGMASLLVSEDELDESIEESKKSLSKES